MRIVIIGGKGLIGQALAAAAIKNGHEVIILTRRSALPIENSSNPSVVQWDGKSGESLAKIIDATDALVNLAGENIGGRKWTEERKRVLLKSRLEPAKALVEAYRLTKNPPKTLIQASAIGVYGTGENEKDENSAIGSDYLARFAAEWEESTTSVESLGIRRIVIRTGIVLDRSHGALPQLMLPFRLMVGGPVSTGRQWYSWIHLSDVVGAILFLFENEKCSGIYNLVSPQPQTNAEIGKALAKVMKRPYWMPVPAFALKLILGEMSTLVVDGQKVLPTRLVEAGYHFLYMQVEEALKNLLLEK